MTTGVNEHMFTPKTAASSTVSLEAALWKGVAKRSELLPAIPPKVLLHAGPPLDAPPPAPLLAAAAMAIQFEATGDDISEVDKLLSDGVWRLEPAQNYGVVTPLAQVVSASMPLAVVSNGQTTAYAPLVEGPTPALRFGTGGAGALARLSQMSEMGIFRISPQLTNQPVDLRQVAIQALEAGDECHSKVGAANVALVEQMPWLLVEDRELLQANVNFVLPLLMAAASVALRTQQEGIVAVGGNGLRFGIRMRGAKDWHSVEATAPRGLLFPNTADTQALGAIGDSAVIDFCGLGAQGFAFAPDLLAALQKTLPSDVLSRSQSVLDQHSGLVSAYEVARSQKAPLVNLAILDREGQLGLIGRGTYEVPLSLFSPL